MLEIKNTEVYNLERAIIASGNPMTMGAIDTRFWQEVDTPNWPDVVGKLI